MNRLPCLCLTIVLAGCAHYVPAPIDLDSTAIALESRSLSDAGLRVFLNGFRKRPLTDWPLQTWDFETLGLAALYFHPELDIARAQWRTAIAAQKTSSARPNPTISLTPEYTANLETSMSPWLAAVQFDVPIETAGKRSIRMQGAGLLSDAARLHVVTASWRIRKRLREALFDHEMARRRCALLGNRLALQSEMLQLYKDRKQVGEIAESEVLPFRSTHRTAMTEVGANSRELADSVGRIAEAIGVAASALDNVSFTIPIELGPLRMDDARHGRRFALTNRSEIREALALYEFSQTALQLEIAKQYPDLHLGTGYQYDQGANKWALGIGIDLPLFNHNEGPIAEACAKREEAAAQVILAQAEVLHEFDSALLATNAADLQVTNARQLLDFERHRVRSATEQAARGEEDRLAVLVTRSEQITRELSLVDAQIAAARARAGLDDAVLGAEGVAINNAAERPVSRAAATVGVQ